MSKNLTVVDFLDEMGLKMVLIEPGDLSVVGELLGLAEDVIAGKGGEVSPTLKKMLGAYIGVLNNLIMGDLDDSADNYEELGQCVIQMQDVARRGDSETSSAIRNFCKSLKKVGFTIDENDFGRTSGRPAEKSSSPQPADTAGVEIVAKAAPASGACHVEAPDFLNDTDLLSGFIEEALEHLESIEVNILELETNPDDLDIINKIFRPFHTIKGVSGFLNLRTVQKLAHTTENLLDDVRNSVMPMNSEVIDVVLKVGDMLRTMVENVKKVLDHGLEHYIEYDISEYVEWIQSIQAGHGSGGAPSFQAAEAAVCELPAKEESESPDAISPSPKKQATAVKSAAVVSRPVRMAVDPEPDSEKSTNGGTAGASPGRKASVGASIKVAIEKLDSLVNAVGELVIMQAMVQQNPLVTNLSDPKLTKDFSQLSRITTELQRTAMAMRMVPIRQTFQKMIRLVRDLSKKSGKNVDLVMSGEETEVDRNMVDSIYDPLVHMIRNSVDHGVQSEAERIKAGKPAAGTVKLAAYQKGGNIVIEIEDDGEGLNTGKIRKKAISRGILQSGDKLSDHELNNLIFLPGFSTADQITDVSGRGVGMDVVKKTVEKLRGKVEVISQPGKGSQFIIRLPLTLAIIDGIVVRVGAERFIIPTIAIQESIKPEKERFNTIQGKGEALMIRNSLVPIIRLYDLFGIKNAGTDVMEAIMVVVENEGRRRALMVDELLGKQEVVIKSLGGLMKDIKGVAGGTILGDGRVGLILDLAGIVSHG